MADSETTHSVVITLSDPPDPIESEEEVEVVGQAKPTPHAVWKDGTVDVLVKQVDPTRK